MAVMGRGLQPDQPSGWEGEVPGAACVPNFFSRELNANIHFVIIS